MSLRIGRMYTRVMHRGKRVCSKISKESSTITSDRMGMVIVVIVAFLMPVEIRST